MSYKVHRLAAVRRSSSSVQTGSLKRRAVMKRNHTTPATLPGMASRQQLNTLMEAMALIIARRQMKRRWPPAGHRAALPSII